MRHTVVFSSLLVLLALSCATVATLFTAVGIVDAARRPVPTVHKTHHYAPEEVHEHMPDHLEPENARKLKCSSCKVLTEEVWTRLHDLDKRRNGRPRMHDQVDLIESMCEEVKKEYGLVMRNNRPTLELSRDPSISRVFGSYVGPYVEGRCGKILAMHEEQILEKYRQVNDLSAFQEAICHKLDKSCIGETFENVNADL